MYVRSLLSRVLLFCDPWAVAHQAPLSMGFPRQGYWSGLPIPPPGDLSNPGIQPRSPALQADSLPSELKKKKKQKPSAAKRQKHVVCGRKETR